MRSVIILTTNSASNALSASLHVILLVTHELVKAHLIAAKTLSPRILFTAHSNTTSSASTDWFHNLPIEDEVHVVSHVER